MRSWVSQGYPQGFTICGRMGTTSVPIGKRGKTAMKRRSDTGGITLKTVHKDKDGRIIQIAGYKVPKDHQVYKILETINTEGNEYENKG